MYLITICAGEKYEHERFEVLVFDYKELIETLNYLKEYEYELISVEQRWICVGLDGFKDTMTEIDSDTESNS